MTYGKNYTIYAIQCDKNKKIYIGRTSQTLKARITNHLQALRTNKHTSKLLQSDFNEYGESSFKFYEIETNVEYQDRIKEKQYMEKYKSYIEEFGYNSSDQYFKGNNKDIEIIKGLPEEINNNIEE